MTDIGKGDWVRCIATYEPVHAGRTYYVEGLIKRPGICSRCGVYGAPCAVLLRVSPRACLCILRPLRKPPSIADILYSSRKEPA